MNNVTDYYPYVGFHFRVSFDALGGNENDIKFQSVTGLDVQLETEPLKEGGENRFEHTMPVRTKYPDLVLKRGLFKPADSNITKWCKDAFDNMIFKPIDITVELLNEQHQPLTVWKVIHAYPKNWKIGELNAERGEVLIETFELCYNRNRMML